MLKFSIGKLKNMILKQLKQAGTVIAVIFL